MTKKEENQQNLSINFKIKLTKKPQPEIKYGKGLYEQLKVKPGSNHVGYDSSNFSMKLFEEAIANVFIKDPARNVKIITNAAGEELLKQAFEKEVNKILKEQNEHRKKLSIRSKIFKQTYKFGQRYN